MCLAIGSLSPCAAENPPINREFQLKTAYLFHFAELAEWPVKQDIRICLNARSVLSRYLPILEGRKIANQTLHIGVIAGSNLENCQIVYLDADEIMTPELQTQARQRHILLVGDGETFAAQGGMLQFTLRDNKLKLLVNLAAVKAADLKLSSKLLRMAEIVE